MTNRKRAGPRVALYDVAGRGGVAQYTYFLAEGLARAGARVTLLTGHDYELRNMPRKFELVVLFRPSWIGAIVSSITRIAGGSRPAVRRAGTAEAAAALALGQLGAGARRGRLRQLRFRFLLLLAAARLVATGTRILHVQWGGDRCVEMWFLRLLKRLGVRTVHTAHDLLPHAGAGPGEEEEIGRLYRTANHIVVLAEQTRRALIDGFGVSADRVTAIPHGGDEVFSAPTQQEARKALGIDESRKVVLFFGTIRPYKGLEYLVQAFDRVRDRVGGVLLLVAGGGPPTDSQESKYYASVVASLRARPEVLAVLEYVPVEHIGVYFSAADVVALPYVRTSHSGVLLSAYATGKPVVVTDTGGLAECVEPGGTGFVVPPCDVAALSDRIEAILRLPDCGKAMGRRARELSEELYSWAAVGKRHVDMYRRLLAPRSAEPGPGAVLPDTTPPGRENAPARAREERQRSL